MCLASPVDSEGCTSAQLSLDVLCGLNLTDTSIDVLCGLKFH